MTSTTSRSPRPQPAIDPRFAQRWVQARREEGRRRLKVLVVAAALVAVAIIGVGLLHSSVFEVRHLTATEATVGGSVLNGGSEVAGPPAPAQLVTIARLSGHLLMIDVNAAAAEHRLDADPWLADARVARSWPDTVHISARTRVPIVTIATGPPGGPTAYALVDATGRVLGSTPTPPPGLPQLALAGPLPPSGQWLPGAPGAGADPAQPAGQMVDLYAASTSADVPDLLTAALALADSLPSGVLSEVTSISAEPSLSLSVVAPATGGTGVLFSFGDGSQLQAKVSALETLLSQADLSRTTSVDLSVPSRPEATRAASGGVSSGSSPGSVSGSPGSAG